LKEFDRVFQETLHFDGQQTVEQRQKVKPFASLTTLKALRVTIKTVCDIVDSMLAAERQYFSNGGLN
jgi:hypothetical protein